MVEPPPRDSKLGDTWTRPIDGMVMIHIPASDFEMGSTNAQIDAALELCEQDRGKGRCSIDWFFDEKPLHAAKLDAYWIDQTEVTNAQYATFLNELGNKKVDSIAWLETEDENSKIEQVNGQFIPKEGFADHPVVEVSWYGAKAYCEWVGGWLPTEPEWEYAARGPDGSVFPWGDERLTCQLANYLGCQETTEPVGSLPDGASWIGALDMAGNVWEWVNDWYKPFPGNKIDNEDYGERFKIIRGGSWNLEAYYLRSAQRNLEYEPNIRMEHIGFRCTATVKD